MSVVRDGYHDHVDSKWSVCLVVVLTTAMYMFRLVCTLSWCSVAWLNCVEWM